jgi:hypothetical protein
MSSWRRWPPAPPLLIRSAQLRRSGWRPDLPSSRPWWRGEWRSLAASSSSLQGASPTVLRCRTGWPPVRAFVVLLCWESSIFRRGWAPSKKRRLIFTSRLRSLVEKMPSIRTFSPQTIRTAANGRISPGSIENMGQVSVVPVQMCPFVPVCTTNRD